MIVRGMRSEQERTEQTEYASLAWATAGFEASPFPLFPLVNTPSRPTPSRDSPPPAPWRLSDFALHSSPQKAVLKSRAVQTLRDCRACMNFAKRLECGRVHRRFHTCSDSLSTGCQRTSVSRNCFGDMPVACLKATQKLLALW